MMVLFLLSLFMTAVCASIPCYKYTFEKLTAQNDLKAIQEPSSVLPAQQVEYCARQCAQDDKCVSLSYHGDQCSIYRSSLSSSGITVSGSRSYIKQGALPSDDPCPLSQGYTSVLYPRVCYKLYNTTPWKTWAESQARCQSDGGRLIILNTTEKHDYIAALMTRTSSQYGALIGLQATSSTSYAWTDGSTFIREGSTVPSSFNSECAYLREDKILTTSCSNSGWSLCEVV